MTVITGDLDVSVSSSAAVRAGAAAERGRSSDIRRDDEELHRSRYDAMKGVCTSGYWFLLYQCEMTSCCRRRGVVPRTQTESGRWGRRTQLRAGWTSASMFSFYYHHLKTISEFVLSARTELWFKYRSQVVTSFTNIVAMKIIEIRNIVINIETKHKPSFNLLHVQILFEWRGTNFPRYSGCYS